MVPKTFLSLLVFSLIPACGAELDQKPYAGSGEAPKEATFDDSSFGAQAAQAGVELAGLILLPAILVALPVIVPGEYAYSQSKVVQPVNVVSASGKPKGTVFESPEDVFVQTRSSIVCSGVIEKPSWGGTSADAIAPLKCNKKKTAFLEAEWTMTTRVATVFVGPVAFRDPATGKTTELSLECKGNFNKQDGAFQPFKLACARGAEAVVISDETADGMISVEFVFNATAV